MSSCSAQHQTALPTVFKLLSVNSVFPECRTGALNIWGTPSSNVVPVPSVTYASTDSQISIHANLLGAQTEAIIQILTWSLNSFSVFFNFDPAPPPSFTEKGPRQQPSKWGRQNRPPLFGFVLSALYWGEGLKSTQGLGRQPHSRSQAVLPQSPKTLQDGTLSTAHFHLKE